MDLSDELLLKALIEGRLQDEDRLRVDDLIARSEEARRQLMNWRGWEELDLSFLAQKTPPATESAQLELAIQKMETEISGLVPEVLQTETSSKFSTPSELELDHKWISRIEGLKVGKMIGRGAMGVVYEGFDASLDRRVAIKIPAKRTVHSPESRERFAREAQAAAQLCHENIVAIHSIQYLDEVPILVQQFVDGETLKAKLERTGALSSTELMGLAMQIARGLTSAHAAGIVHRDLKPENLLMERDTNIVRIADFGLAKRDSSSLLTHPEVVAGTPAYMSPEQTLGQTLDARSDLFSLGSVLRFAATGAPPFGAEDTDVVLHRIRTQTLEPLHRLRPDLPKAMCDAFDRLLTKNSNQRTASAADFLQQLSEPSKPRRVWYPTAILASSLGMLSLLTVVGLWLSTHHADASKDRLENQQLAASDQVKPTNQELLESPFGILGGDRFRTLAEAIRSAKDGQTIVVEGNGPFETSRIDISHKRLSIVAGENASPLFIPKKGPISSNQQFLISDRELLIKGLRIDWPIEIEITDFQKMFEMPAVFCNGDLLTIDGCEIKRGATGISAYGSRSILIKDCRLSGGSHCIGWTDFGDKVTVHDTTLDSKGGLLLFYAPANMAPNRTGEIRLSHVSFSGESSVEIVFSRVQTKPFHIRAENCKLLSKGLISLIGTPALTNQTTNPRSMITLMQGGMTWHETDCSHPAPQSYLSSRMLKRPERRFPSDINSLEAWRKLWNAEFEGSIESR